MFQLINLDIGSFYGIFLGIIGGGFFSCPSR